MSKRLGINEASIPRVPRYVKLRFDKTRARWVILAPERVLVPDDIAVEILKLVDGIATVGAIADTLAAKFAAPRGEICADVAQMLQDLADKGMLEA